MPLYYSNFKSFSNKISRIFLLEQLYVRPLLAILKGQYRPWARRGRPGQGWYGWISTFWCHRKPPYAEHWISGLPKQIMPTLVKGPSPSPWTLARPGTDFREYFIEEILLSIVKLVIWKFLLTPPDIWVELWGHPHCHGEPQHQKGQGLILEHISLKRYCLSLWNWIFESFSGPSRHLGWVLGPS